MEALEVRLTPTAHIWDGGTLANDNWSDNRNWEGDVAPVAGDELRFPASVRSTDKSTINDFPSDTRFSKIVVEDGYSLAGHSIIVGGVNLSEEIETSGVVSISFGIRGFNNNSIVDILDFDVSGGSLNMSGRIAGERVRIRGTGTMTMSGSLSNTYTGSTLVAAKLVLAKLAGVTSIPGNVEIQNTLEVFNSNQIADSSQVNLGGNLRFLGVAETVGSITFTSDSAGQLDLTNNSVINAGVVTPASFFPNFAGEFIAGSGQQLVDIRLGTSSTLSIGNLFADKVSLGSNSILKAGNTTLDLKANVDLASGSVMTVNSLLVRGGVNITGEGTLALNGDATFEVRPFHDPLSPPPIPPVILEENHIFIHELRLGNANRTFNVVKLSAFGSVENFTVAPTIINAKITGGAGVGLTKNGNGILKFGGDTSNTYPGTTTVNDGELSLVKGSNARAISGPLVVGTNDVNVASFSVKVIGGGGDQISNNHLLTINRSGVVQSFANAPETIGPLTLQGGTIENFNELTINGDITTLPSDITAQIFSANINTAPLNLGRFTRNFNVADGTAVVDLRLSEKFTGDSNFRKQGAGLMQSSTVGVNNVTMNGGTLFVEGAGFTTNVIVNGGSLSGFGGILANVTVNAGSIAASPPIGLLLLQPKAVNFKSPASFVVNAFTQAGLQGEPLVRHDLMVVGGDLSLGDASGSPTLDFRPTATFTPGTTFIIANLSQQGSKITGKFKTPQGTILNEGSTFTANGQNFTISYQGNGQQALPGNDIVLTRNSGPAFQNRTLTPQLLEGQIATLTGTITEPDSSDTFFLDVNWADGSPVETFTFPPGLSRNVAVTHRYVDDGKFNVSMLWRDQLGGSNNATLPIKVRNVDPTLANMAFVGPVVQGQFTILTGTIIDPGNDGFRLDIKWNDGGPKETYYFSPGTTNFSIKHRFAKSRNAKVQFKIVDSDGGSNEANLRVHVSPSD